MLYLPYYIITSIVMLTIIYTITTIIASLVVRYYYYYYVLDYRMLLPRPIRLMHTNFSVHHLGPPKEGRNKRQWEGSK